LYYNYGDIISLKAQIDDFLKGYKKLIILGIGNELCGDDCLGPYIINEFESFLNINDEDINIEKNIILINGGSAPENFTGMIKKENPSHILIVDAALMNSDPGSIKLLNTDEIANVSVSTHSMSLSYLIKYLKNDLEFNFLFIGIEPFSMNLGDQLSPKVLDSVNHVKNILLSVLT
jgi:hydrogenase 3 maturation protease